MNQVFYKGGDIAVESLKLSPMYMVLPLKFILQLRSQMVHHETYLDY